jgi:hypothetical protein
MKVMGDEKLNEKKEMLFSNLIRIKNEEYELRDSEKPIDYIKDMLEFIGDPDPELRDELIYTTFCKWIAEKGYLNDQERCDLLHTLLGDNYLYYKLGHDGDDTVFTRSFSVLVIDVLLWRNRQQMYLPSEHYPFIKERLIGYYKNEKDLRGYVDKKGWAHAAAHGADAMCELAQWNESDESVMLEILQAITDVLNNGKYMFCDEEDERISLVVTLMVKKKLISKEKLCDWISELRDSVGSKYSHEQYLKRVNLKNFIRSFYFSLLHQPEEKDLIQVLFETEEKLNTFHSIQKQLVQ